jgi:hypothetical protein
MGLPRDDIGEAIDLDLFQHRVEFKREANGNSSPATMAPIIRVLLIVIISMIMIVMMDKVPLLVLLGTRG